MLVRREIRPTFDSLMNDILTDFGAFNQFRSQLVKPSTNIKEFDNHIEIEMAVSGFNKENFDIQLNDHTLTIESKSNQSKEESAKEYFLQEFEHRQFSRSFALSDDIDTENINAKYENGILRLELTKKEYEEKSQLRQISIS